MKINRSIKSNGNLNTKLYDLLSNVGDNVLYHEEHFLRHPYAIYNIAFLKVVNRANSAIDFIAKSDPNSKNIYKSFLESVNEFVDDTYNILKCFYPLAITSSKAKFSNKWLESINKPGMDQYRKKIEQYIEDTRYIMNKLKHEHGRLSQIELLTTKGNCFGFFLEKYENGTLTPDKKVHKPFGGKSTANSYLKDILRNLFVVYFVSNCLVEYFEMELNILAPVSPVSYFGDEMIISLLEKIWDLPLVLFPQEYNESLFSIEFDSKSQELNVQYPADINVLSKFKKSTILKGRFIGSGDGVSKSFNIPYL